MSFGASELVSRQAQDSNREFNHRWRCCGRLTGSLNWPTGALKDFSRRAAVARAKALPLRCSPCHALRATQRALRSIAADATFHLYGGSVRSPALSEPSRGRRGGGRRGRRTAARLHGGHAHGRRAGRLKGVIGPTAAGLFSNSASSEAPQHLQLREFRATGRRRRNGAEVLRILGRGAGR